MSRTPGDMVQVHLLTAYPASLLNRDDAGLAKRIPFGEAMRTRISSQCLKKHWREAPGIADLGDSAIRSTRIYEQLVAEPLTRDPHGATKEEADAIARYLLANTLTVKEEKAAKSDDEAPSGVRTGQVVVLTRAETDFLADKAAELLGHLRATGASATDAKSVEKALPFGPADKKAHKQQLQALAASIDTALFGRMVTSDLFARVDAAVSVAHAFTTHAEAAETDYFTAVDMLNQDDAGAGLINDTELTTGVFYTYATIDMHQLRANLGAQAHLAERLARNLVLAMATVSPGAKRGSTAPYAYAEFLLLERGASQPRTLANAFLHPVRASGAGLMAASIDALVDYRQRLGAMYDTEGDTAAAATIHKIPDGAGLEAVPVRRALATILPEA